MVWIIANWKDKMPLVAAHAWLSVVGSQLPVDPNLKITVCPDENCLKEVKKEVESKNYHISVGMQDLPVVDKDLAEITILGHSSRRQTGETNETVEQKVKQALQGEIIPLVCVQDENTPVPDKVKLIAYEPVFAIGTGNPDTPENANTVAKTLKQKYGESLEVLYGGSVNSHNVAEFISQENISGVLIGRASLDGQEFVRIINACQHLQM